MKKTLLSLVFSLLFLHAYPSDRNKPLLLSKNGEIAKIDDDNGIELSNDFSFLTSERGERHPIVNAIEILGATAQEPRPFVTTWKTDNPGVSEDNQITIGAVDGVSYNYTVVWGDGTSDSGVNGNITHTYAAPGIYQVAISGDFPEFELRISSTSGGTDRPKIVSIDQWGDIEWKTMSYSFANCKNLDVKAIDVPDLSSVSSTAGMFRGCSSLVGNASFSEWDMSNVTNLSRMFERTQFNEPIESWDVSKVTDMSSVFSGSSFNQDIGNWNVGNVKEMVLMFNFSPFNQDIGSWNVSKVRSMRRMFSGSSFNKSIAAWDVSSVLEMNDMFYGASNFNQGLSTWDVSNVEGMESIFANTDLSNENYNGILLGWGQLPSLQEGVILKAPKNKYCTGWAARQRLSNDFSWVIVDAGRHDDCAVASDFALRINAGGSETVYNGQTFVADTYFDTGSTSDRPSTGLPEPYQSMRFSRSQQMGYDIPLSDGEYTVNLYFAELWFGATGGGAGGVGSRVFDVSIEGQLAEDNLDVFAEVGADVMLMKTYTVTVTGSVLNIDFDSRDAVGGERHPIINAIEILGAAIGIPEYRPFVMTIYIEGDPEHQGSNFRLDTYDEDYSYNYNVNWGDGNITLGATGDTNHYYEYDGQYTIAISGKFPKFKYDYSERPLFIDQWGSIEWVSFEGAFSSLEELYVLASDTPNLSNGSSLSRMFANTYIKGDFSFAEWNVSTITDMSAMFLSSDFFDQDLSNWDVSNVTTMANMFDDTDLSNENYDKILLGWSGLPSLQNDVVLSAGNAQYCLGEEARQKLIDDFGWQIEDGGKADDCQEPDDFALRINAGGSETDYNDKTFIADTYFDTGNTLDRPQTGLPEPYQSFRFSRSQQMSYDIPLEDGEYTVNLYFAELWFGATGGGAGGVGSRVFDVSIEGQLAEDNLDVFAEVGADAMLMKSYTINVTDGVLDIDFDSRDTVGGERHPIINAIEILGTETQGQRPFVTTWKTDNPGVSEDNQITIPSFSDEPYKYSVNWGDGTVDSGVTRDITHSYATPGTYQVSIFGDFPRFYSTYRGDEKKLLLVEQWGDIEWTSMANAFSDCTALNVVATDIPDLSNVTSMARMFENCNSLEGNATFNDWDVGNVINANGLFRNAVSFNQPIGNWDVGKVKFMLGMFNNAWAFNQDISNWDVGSVIVMASMFNKAEAFNQPIGNWNVSNVENMSIMFYEAKAFNQPLGDWNLDNVKAMSNMFNKAEAFDQPIGNWNVSNVENMKGMFYEAKAFNQPIGDWDVGQVKSMSTMFYNASSFNIDIGSWDTSNVINMSHMFWGAYAFDQNIGDWNISNVASMGSMFNLINLSIENYDSLLNGWSNQQLQPGVEFHGGNSQYCLGETARQRLIDDFSWLITDAGKAYDCSEPSDFALRINAGGSEIDYNGETFMADAYFDVGRTLDRPQTGLPEPYQSFRYSRSQEMGYDIPLPNGAYTVNLYFAELWFGATGGGSGGVGSRVFDVSIEGQLVEDNLDVFAEVGADAMLVNAYSVTITDGVLEIDFSSLDADGGTRHPIINAIEILGNTNGGFLKSVIGEKQNSNTMSIYPNQATTYATVTFEEPTQVRQVLVFDMIGRLVQSYNPKEIKNGDDYTIDVNFYQQGAYIIKMVDNKGATFQKQMMVKRQ